MRGLQIRPAKEAAVIIPGGSPELLGLIISHRCDYSEDEETHPSQKGMNCMNNIDKRDIS